MTIKNEMIKISGNKVQHEGTDAEIPAGLNFQNTGQTPDYQVQAAITEANGDFIYRDEIIDEIFSLEPNYVKTYTYKSDGDPSPITTINYSDGFGRALQSQLMTSKNRAIVTGTYYDEFNRPAKVPKEMNLLTGGKFYLMFNNRLLREVNKYYVKKYPAEGEYAYYETKYYNDPFSRIKETGAPGRNYSLDEEHHLKYWYFGIDVIEGEFQKIFFIPIDPFGGGPIPGGTYTINFKDGFVIKTDLTDLNLDVLAYCKIEPSHYFVTVTKDPNGNYSQEIYDKFGNTLKKWAHTGEYPIISKNEYTILGQVIKELPPNTDVAPCEYRYNSLGSLEEKWSPERNTTQYFYNSIGMLEKTIYANGKTVLYEYDDLNRIIKIKEKIDEQEIVRIRNFYDNINDIEQELRPVPNLTTILGKLHNTKNRLVAEVAFNSGLSGGEQVVDLYSYDDEGRIKTTYKSIEGMEWQKIAFEYDDILGIIKTKTVYPDYLSGNSIDPIVTNFTYNNLNLISSIQNENRDLISYSYSLTNQLISKSFHKPDASIKTAAINYNYTLRNEITNINAYNDIRKVTEFNETIHYDGLYNGNIKGTDFTYYGNQEQLTYDYTYDNINRLTSVDADDQHNEYDEAFKHDANGRILNKEKGVTQPGATPDYEYKKCTYNATEMETNKLDRVVSKHPGDNNYGFDENGNLIADVDKEVQIVYDWRDMPVLMELRPETGEFVQLRMIYDAGGNRVIKKVKTMTDATATVYVNNQLVYHNEDYEDEDEPYVLLYAQLGDDGRINYYQDNTDIFYYLKDHLGSTRSVINENGEQILAYTYTAYGECIPVVVDPLNPEMRIRELFTGKEFDNEGYDEDEQLAGVGFYYFGARFYDPEIGIFTSTDAAGQDFFSYGYCAGNPVILVDPDGNYWIGQLIGAFVGFAAGGLIGGAINDEGWSWSGAFQGMMLGASIGSGIEDAVISSWVKSDLSHIPTGYTLEAYGYSQGGHFAMRDRNIAKAYELGGQGKSVPLMQRNFEYIQSVEGFKGQYTYQIKPSEVDFLGKKVTPPKTARGFTNTPEHSFIYKNAYKISGKFEPSSVVGTMLHESSQQMTFQGPIYSEIVSHAREFHLYKHNLINATKYGLSDKVINYMYKNFLGHASHIPIQYMF